MRRLLNLILAAGTCSALVACGYKGPLVHPGATPAATSPATSPAANPATPATAPASARSG